MAYVRDIARQAIAQLGLESGYELAATFVSDSYVELCSRAQFRHLRKLGQLYLPAPLGINPGPTGPVNFGTFTVTLNSPIVVADSDASTALAAVVGAPEALTGQWFRIQQGSVWYRILRADPSNPAAWTLELETPYASDNNAQGIFSSGAVSGPINYYIIPRFIDLDPTARTIGTIVCDAVYRPLEMLSEDQMNILFSSRQLVAFPPRWFAILGTNENATGLPKSIEIFPWPVNSTTLHYTYWKHPEPLSLDSYVQPTIDPDILREGAKTHLMQNLMGRAVRAGQLEQAALWRNEYRAQQTLWETMVGRAVRNDRGGDDVKFILSSKAWFRPDRPGDWDPVTDAYQNFLSRGL